jgi:hypothetical protein
VLNGNASRSRFSRYRACIAAVVAVGFLVLVFGASTHVHTDRNGEDGCAVHMAVVGKLEGPSSPAVAVAPPSVVYLCHALQSAPRVERVILVVLPPSCGPPSFA